MKFTKAINVPLVIHMNLSSGECPKTEEETHEMNNIPLHMLLVSWVSLCLAYVNIIRFHLNGC